VLDGQFGEEEAEADASHRPRVPADEVIANLAYMIETAEQAGARTILVPAPHSNRLKRTEQTGPIRELNDAIRQHFAGRVAIPDLAVMDWRSNAAHRFYKRDGYHPNARGARLIGSRLSEEILRP
jgi:lysophospholipase L1-like esterase